MTESVPGPKGNVLLGSLLDFRKDPPNYLLDVAKQYGEIANFRLLNFQIYLLSSPEAIQEVLVTKRASFEKSKLDQDILGKFLGNGILLSESDFHKQQRKMVQPAFHVKRIQAYADTMVHFADKMLDKWEGQTDLDIVEEMMDVSMRIVSKTLFDAEVDDAESVGHAMEELQGIANAEYRTAFAMPEWVPIDRNRRMKRARNQLDATVMRFISQRKAEGTPDKGDLLSMLLLSEDEDGYRMPDEQVRHEAVTLFAAGHETTSNALTWTWFLLAQHPDIEAKFHTELDTVLDGRLPTLEDMKQLPYTHQVLKEAMRLYPPAWILNGRTALEDVEIAGYTIPKDSRIFVSPYVIHRLPQFFENPDDFNPDRFAPEIEKSIEKYTYLPFGGGPRVCIGNHFAMMEAVLILATVGQRYRLQLVPNQTVEMEALVTLCPLNGIQMELIKREEPILEMA